MPKMENDLFDNDILPNGQVIELTEEHGRFYINMWDSDYLILHEGYDTEEEAREEYERKVLASTTKGEPL